MGLSCYMYPRHQRHDLLWSPNPDIDIHVIIVPPIHDGNDMGMGRSTPCETYMFPSVKCSELDGNYAPSGIWYMCNAHDSSMWWYLSVTK